MRKVATPPEAPLGEDSAVVQLFKALAHPMRASIVYRLISSPADVTELVAFSAGALSPYGEIEWPVDSSTLPYVHPDTVINR